MKQVPLSALESKIIRPGFEKHLTPLLMYRGNLSLGRAHRLWNLLVSAMEHEATYSDITQRLVMNADYSQLCGPDKPVTLSGVRGFVGRLIDNPLVMGEMPGLSGYVRELLPWYKGPPQLARVSEESRRSRNVGVGGWRTFEDRRPVATPLPKNWNNLALRKSNAELIELLGVSQNIISRWRRETGLKAVVRDARAEARPALIYPFLIHDAGKPEHDLLRKVNEAVPRYLDPELRADICQDLVVGILCGDFSVDDLGLPAKEMTRRVRKMFPDKYGPLSLDAIMAGTDDLKLLDTIADDHNIWDRA